MGHVRCDAYAMGRSPQGKVIQPCSYYVVFSLIRTPFLWTQVLYNLGEKEEKKDNYF